MQTKIIKKETVFETKKDVKGQDAVFFTKTPDNR